MNTKPSNAEIVWDKEMTVGNLEAKNYFIIYSDIACPYCIAFENAIVEHEEEFKEYIEKNDVLVEIRLSDFLYEYGESQSIESRYGAEAIFCAKKEGKFWDYYNLAITKVWNEYFKDSGKNAFSKFNKLKKDYWIEMGEGIGLGDDFKKCVEEDEVLDEVVASAKKTVKLVTGMPHFKFNNYTSGGFDLSWGWDYVLMYFDAGLES
jgi:protein-disulfide isomerase